MAKAPRTADVAGELLAADQGPPAPKYGKGKLALLVGASCCAALWPTVDRWEGNKPVPYRDIVGIWTVCRGDTKSVVPGQRQTEAQCDERFERQLIAHAEPVLKCAPELKAKPNALAASISLAYNIGPGGFCASTAKARFRAGDIRGGCAALMNFNGVVTAAPLAGALSSTRITKGKNAGKWFNVVRGLDNRRKEERRICLRDAA